MNTKTIVVVVLTAGLVTTLRARSQMKNRLAETLDQIEADLQIDVKDIRAAQEIISQRIRRGQYKSFESALNDLRFETIIANY